MSEPYIGEIKLVGFSYAPRGYALCIGEHLSISDHSALFALLGTAFGGNGRTDFALPDLRSRVPVGQGTGPGLPTFKWGQSGGDVSVTLDIAHMPSHTHQAVAARSGDTSDPSGAVWGEAAASVGVVPSGIPVEVTAGRDKYTGQTTGDAEVSVPAPNAYSRSVPDTNMSPNAIQATGGGESFFTMPPFLGLYYIIALTGIFPPRN